MSIPRYSHMHNMAVSTKCYPPSLTISLGNYCLENNSMRQVAICLADMTAKGKQSVHPNAL